MWCGAVLCGASWPWLVKKLLVCKMNDRGPTPEAELSGLRGVPLEDSAHHLSRADGYRPLMRSLCLVSSSKKMKARDE